MWRRYNIPVQISGGFFLFIAWFGLVNGWGLLGLTLLAALAHEVGHLLALKVVGGRVTSFSLGVLGAAMGTDSAALSYRREMLVVAAGPAMNLILAAAASGWGGANPLWVGINLVLCLFNLLPVRPLDGGRLLELAVSWVWGPLAGERAAAAVGAAASLGLALFLLWLVWATGGSLWLLPAAAGLMAAALREIQGELAAAI